MNGASVRNVGAKRDGNGRRLVDGFPSSFKQPLFHAALALHYYYYDAMHSELETLHVSQEGTEVKHSLLTSAGKDRCHADKPPFRAEFGLKTTLTAVGFSAVSSSKLSLPAVSGRSDIQRRWSGSRPEVSNSNA